MKYRDKLRFSIAGHALGVTLQSVDYKEEEALKSCHTEFHHIIGAAFYKENGNLFWITVPLSFYADVGDCETMIRDAETDDVSREDR